MGKYVLITGTSSGIGKAVALRLLDRGFDVFGCDRQPASIEHPHFYGITMDVTSEEAVQAAFISVSRMTDRLAAVVNVCGVMFMGSLIEEPAGRLEQIMSVNLLGMERVNRIFFPMIEKGHGRILNFSSEFGTYAVIPFNAYYTISKHAVESYSDGLRRELQYLKIPVVTIRPGAFRTDMEKSIGPIYQKIVDSSTHYRSVFKKMEPILSLGTILLREPDVMAKVVVKALTARKPRNVYSCNHNPAIKLMSVLPGKWIDVIFYYLFREQGK